MGIPVEGKQYFPDHQRARPAHRARERHPGRPAAGFGPHPAARGGDWPAAGPPAGIVPGLPAPQHILHFEKLKVPVNGDIGCYTLG